MNIAILPDKQLINRIFTDEQLNRLKQLGDVRINPQVGLPSIETVQQLIVGADVAITSWGCPSIGHSILDCAPNLKLIAHAAGTVKPIVTQEMMGSKIRVSTANNALARGVAETALGLTIVSLKNMWQLAGYTRIGDWDRGRDRVRELYEITIGIVGGGNSGRHLIRLLQNFDTKILVYDPYLSTEEIGAMGAVKADWEQLLHHSDVVSIHAPSLPETNQMFNERSLKLMKDDAILINLARGSLVDEAALVGELRKGRLWACIDVTDPEPPAIDHPFRSLPNVTLLPHVAGAVNNGLHRIGNFITSELTLFHEGLPLQGEVDLEQLPVMA